MNLRSIAFVTSLLFIFGCNNDQLEPRQQIYGHCNLINKCGGFAGINCTYELSEQTWTFEQSVVTIVDNANNTGASCASFFEGSYSYEVQEVEGKQFLLLEEDNLGRIVISNNELTIASKWHWNQWVCLSVRKVMRQSVNHP